MLQSFIADLINSCSRDTCEYHEQCLVILEHQSKVASASSSHSSVDSSSCNSTESRLSLKDYFDHCFVTRMVVIERPRDNCQVYVAKNLGKFFHFSCQTIKITQLYHAIKGNNNFQLEILFVPRSCEVYMTENIYVCNQNSCDASILQNGSDFDSLMKIIDETGTLSNAASKRSEKSISIGLQTMYSHQQHTSRYCMLPHSYPFVPTVKKRPTELSRHILDAYLFSSEVISSSFTNLMIPGRHPLSLEATKEISDEEKCIRLGLRSNLFDNIFGIHRNNVLLGKEINLDEMFESCSVQETGMLRFHRDTMNCPKLDNTIAIHVPSRNNYGKSCLSFLFYSRKCVGDFSEKKKNIEKYISNETDNCRLTILCLKSILEVKGIFNYQGSLYENVNSLHKIASKLLLHKAYACPEVSRFTGLQCFRHGAAFDKMGYYSIFLNVLMSMHYLGLISNIDDTISLCIYFGLLCNGTSNLAAAWKDVEQNIDFCREWLSGKEKNTRLFSLLILLENRRRSTIQNNQILIGCCKLPRFQYSNYGTNIVNEIDSVHSKLKAFVRKRLRPTSTRHTDSDDLHKNLFKCMNTIKGIGPLSYNQLWQCLCLSGVLPITYIYSISVAPSSGPAKLIQTYYNECKTDRALISKLHEVKGNIHAMGMNRINSFILENKMCEIWRLGAKTKLATESMTVDQRKAGFGSDELHNALVSSLPTKNPDIYYKNPFTGEWQHLFRLGDKGLQMRPSFLDNSDSGSSTLTCEISYNNNGEQMEISWSGSYLKKKKTTGDTLFIPSHLYVGIETF